MLIQVLLNLPANAAKFTREGSVKVFAKKIRKRRSYCCSGYRSRHCSGPFGADF
ncbi:MAG TPA: hypothetical protein GXX46_01680 [Peptococcaceae bacterium]|nr:hypothetical protein [Peptococcaceae bacterium]